MIDLFPPASAAIAAGPRWTFTAGTIGAGLFTTNASGIAATNTITLADTALDGGSAWTAYLIANVAGLLITGATGAAYFRVTGGSSVGGNAQLTVSFNAGAGQAAPVNWSGSYTVIPMPGIVEIQTAAGIVPVTSSAVTPVTSVTPTKGFITEIS